MLADGPGIDKAATRDFVGSRVRYNGISRFPLANATIRDQDERVAHRHDGSPPHLDDVSKGIIEQLQKDGRMPEVDYVIVTAGSFDLIVEVVCESDDHLLELLSKRIRSVAGVKSTESFVYLKLHKQTYSWGVR